MIRPLLKISINYFTDEGDTKGNLKNSPKPKLF
jgi:hypothetical protein